MRRRIPGAKGGDGISPRSEKSMEKELILEIGTEEMPASFIEFALSDLKEGARKKLEGAALNFKEASTYATPRRLTLRVSGLADKQEDQTKEAYGPPVNIAYDDNGKPTKPALGFAKSQGVDIKDVVRVKRDRGEFLAVVKEFKGQKTEKLLKEILPDLILSIPFRKSMRWGDGEITFARPIRWVLAVYGGKTVTFDLGGVSSSSKSYGHRFMHPGAFKVTGWDDYNEKLENGYVILDQDRRKSDIIKGVNTLAKNIGGKIAQDEELLETVTNLVEYPLVLKGDFEKEFLELPREVLISVMKNHQKYFPVTSAKNKTKLLPHFIFVCGTPVKDNRVVVKGNERVIRARFTDARFFFDEDKRSPLGDKVDELKGMVFLSNIGSYFDKAERLKLLASSIAKNIDFKGSIKDIETAAWLSKADLATQMVFEFPELQGIMGKYYAELCGEKKEVAKAIEEHYMPVSRDGELPGSDIGSIVSIADKADTISACFISGLIPTGTQDPYALRRQAIGIINIILERGYHLSLCDLFEVSLNTITKQTKTKLKEPKENVFSSISDFITERFRNVMISEGYSQDVVDAVVSVELDDIVEAQRKIEALSEFRKAPDFVALGIAFKRVVNIVKDHTRTKVKESLFLESVEKELYDSFNKVREKVDSEISVKNYEKSLSLMKDLKEPVDKYFEGVMVMDKDPDLKKNRLSMLSHIRELFFKIADFSKLST
jgi:glycyl-tRNA synthetase beta chain